MLSTDISITETTYSASFNTNLVISKCVTAVILSNFSGHYLRNRSTLVIGVLGYIGIVQHKEHSPEVLSIPPGTPCILYIDWIQPEERFPKVWRIPSKKREVCSITDNNCHRSRDAVDAHRPTTPTALQHVRREYKVYSENNQSQKRLKDSQQPEDVPHSAEDNECNCMTTAPDKLQTNVVTGNGNSAILMHEWRQLESWRRRKNV